MTESIAFPPCPFCGSLKATLMQGPYVECIECGARGPFGDDTADLLAKWANRNKAGTPPLDGGLAAPTGRGSLSNSLPNKS